MKRARGIWTALTVLGLGLALGGGLCAPEEEEPEEVPSSAGKVIKALCEYSIRCEAELGRSMTSEEACVDFYSDLVSCGYYMDFGWLEVELVFAFRESGSAECITWLETSDCGADDDGDACADILETVGGLAEGASCQSDLSAIRTCQVDLYCDDDQPDRTCSVCMRKPGVGGSCSLSDPGIPCASDTFCDPIDLRCKAELADGEDCSGGGVCESGWCSSGVCTASLERNTTCAPADVCKGSLRCHDGICTDKADLGQPCTGEGDCIGPAVCLDGSCAQVDLCTPAAVGAACLMRCVEGSYCEDNRCVAFRGGGETCADSQECGYPTQYCQSNACTSYAQVGESCGADQQCQFLEAYCDVETDPGNFTCATAKATGQPCGNALECASFNCDPVSDTCAYPSEICEMP